jgi:uncharacterized protein (DUF736 family)
MTTYDNTNTGALFKNNRKETEKHPDYTGSVNVAGRDHWLSAWLKTDKNGNKFMSLSIKPKDGTSARPDPAQEFKREAQRVFPDAQLDDSDVPF